MQHLYKTLLSINDLDPIWSGLILPIFIAIFRIGKILYIPGCLSVGPSVGPSVRPSIEIQSFEATNLKLGG